MNDLKFELSVLFAKTELSPFTRNDDLIESYSKMFNKEINQEELNQVLGEIINDQLIMYNNYVQEIPDDYELK